MDIWNHGSSRLHWHHHPSTPTPSNCLLPVAETRGQAGQWGLSLDGHAIPCSLATPTAPRCAHSSSTSSVCGCCSQCQQLTKAGSPQNLSAFFAGGRGILSLSLSLPTRCSAAADARALEQAATALLLLPFPLRRCLLACTKSTLLYCG